MPTPISPARAPKRMSTGRQTPVKTSAKPTREDKRPDPKDYTKYEKHLPFNLEDFMNQYVAFKIDGVEHAVWKQSLVDEFERDIHEQIRIHWKSSSKTRLHFGVMNAEDVWEEQSTMTMALTKRNLATLDPKFLPQLDHYVAGALQNKIETIRIEAVAIVNALYLTTDVRSGFEARMVGDTNMSWTFENLELHLDLQAELRKEFNAKFAVIETLRKRELFVQNLVNFELRIRESAKSGTMPIKGKKDYNIWLPRFRTEASKILQKASNVARKMIAQYQESTGNTFDLYGQTYETEFLEKQLAQTAKVKTNFRYMTGDVLFFDNPLGEPSDSPICQRILDDVLEPLLADAVQESLPPAMPSFSDDMEFTFKYY